MVAIGDRLGLIADLLAGQPAARTEVDQAAVRGPAGQRGAPLSTRWRWPLWRRWTDRPWSRRPRWLLRGVLVRTERFALLPPRERSGPLRGRGRGRPRRGSLDGAIDRLGARHDRRADVAAAGDRDGVAGRRR